MAKRKMSGGLRRLLEAVRGREAFLQSEEAVFLRSAIRQSIESEAKAWARSIPTPAEDVEGYVELGEIARRAQIALSEQAQRFLEHLLTGHRV